MGRYSGPYESAILTKMSSSSLSSSKINQLVRVLVFQIVKYRRPSLFAVLTIRGLLFVIKIGSRGFLPQLFAVLNIQSLILSKKLILEGISIFILFGTAKISFQSTTKIIKNQICHMVI